MGFRDLAYRLYERRLQASLSPGVIPRHVGVMCDGNRRWAKSAGFRDVSSGHRKGADKIFELLDWCRETGVEVVTLWLLSTYLGHGNPSSTYWYAEAVPELLALAAERRDRAQGARP